MPTDDCRAPGSLDFSNDVARRLEIGAFTLKVRTQIVDDNGCSFCGQGK
jgi:hypothetical protein